MDYMCDWELLKRRKKEKRREEENSFYANFW